jgi:spore protease
MKKMLFLDAATTYQDKKILVGVNELKNQTVCHYQVLEKDQKSLGHDPGDYFTVQFTSQILEEKPSSIQKEVEKILRLFLKKYHKDRSVLVVGLGNADILVDSFGSNVTNKMIATNHYNDFLTVPKITLLNPSVMAKTGISSFKLIQLIVNDIKPDTIILIDSLATKQASSLNRIIEISDTGIIPGSALRTNKEITKKTFNIPILSIGAPFLLKQEEGLFESIHLASEIEQIAQIIANSLNRILLF